LSDLDETWGVYWYFIVRNVKFSPNFPTSCKIERKTQFGPIHQLSVAHIANESIY